jgi:hypothetical protein
MSESSVFGETDMNKSVGKPHRVAVFHIQIKMCACVSLFRAGIRM